MANTCITQGELFFNTHVYITNIFCVRLRLYPAQPIVSGTSGSFKHILYEKPPIKLTKRGIINLMNCYYIGSNQLSQEFTDFVMLSKTSHKELKPYFKFFKEHLVDFSVLGDNILYITMLHLEILKAERIGANWCYG